MSGRASVLELVQVAVETVAGDGTGANKRMMATDIRITPSPRLSGFGSPGSKVETHQTQAKGWSGLNITGRTVSYNDLTYLLASLLRAPTGTGVWTYDLTPFAADTLKTLAIERGQVARAEKAAYGVVSGLDFRFTETEVSLSGSGFARKRSENATMTSSPTKLAPVVIDPKSWRVSVGASVAGLTAVDKVLEAGASIQNRWRPGVYGNADESFSDITELAPTLGATLIVRHDSVASSYLADLEASTQRFMRISAVGPNISEGVDYGFQMTFPFWFRQAEPGDANDEVVSTFRLGMGYEENFDSGIEVVLTNALSGL